jgi:hypothetical protein
MDFEALLARVKPADVDGAKLRDIEGWLAEEAGELTCRLVHLQRARGHATGVLELGVFKGKYLAFLAALHRPDGVPLVGVDGFLARIGEPLDAHYRAEAKRLICANVASLTGGGPPPLLIAGLTRDVDAHAIAALCPGGYSFISVDAGHEADDLVTDLALAAATASPHALVAVDDVFNHIVPGVAEGVCRFFIDHPGCALRPFAMCGNKLFFSTAGEHATYLAYCKWLLVSAHQRPFIARSAVLHEGNRRNNFVPRFLGHEVVAFMWNAA